MERIVAGAVLIAGALGACQPEPPVALPTPEPVVAEAPAPEPTLQERVVALEATGRHTRLVRSWAAGEVTALDLSIEGSMALVGTCDGEVTGWLLPEALLERQWVAPPQGESGPVVAVGLWWSHVWAVWQRGEELWLTDLSTDRQVGQLPVPASQLVELDFPREQDWLLLALADGSTARWLPPDGELVPLEATPPELDPAARSARWEAAGLGPQQGLETREGRELEVSMLAGPRQLAADERTLLALHGERVGLWHTDALTVLTSWGGPPVVARLAVAPDGRLVAVDSGAGVEIRDAASGTVLIPALEAGGLPGWEPFASPSAAPELEGVTAGALAPDGSWLVAAAGDAPLITRWELDPHRRGRVLDTRLDRMLRADPYSSDALLARAELAALAGRWSRCADLLGQAEQVGAVVHPADQLRALGLAGRLGGARELLARLSPTMIADPAVQAWAVWLEAQPEG